MTRRSVQRFLIQFGVWVLPAVFWLAIACSSHATTLRKLSLPEMVAAADTVVTGKCEKQQTVWMEKKVVTISTIRVSQAAKGDATGGKSIDVYTLGGRVTKPLPVYMMVPGAEEITQGEEMVLFLEKFGDKKQFHRVVGMAQGKLPVTTDAKTGKKQVHYPDSVKGVCWVDGQGKTVAPNAVGVREEPTELGNLDGFLGRIHKIKTEQEAAAKKGGVK